jgi:hypothetical protein
MKYANKPSASSDKNVSDSSVPKKIKPISSVPAAKSTKKTPIKSSKKKPTKKGESKNPLSMTDLYEKENPFVSD